MSASGERASLRCNGLVQAAGQNQKEEKEGPPLHLGPPAAHRSLDAVSKPPGEGAVTTDFKKLFSDMSANCSYADMAEVEKVLAKA